MLLIHLFLCTFGTLNKHTKWLWIPFESLMLPEYEHNECLYNVQLNEARKFRNENQYDDFFHLFNTLLSRFFQYCVIRKEWRNIHPEFTNSSDSFPDAFQWSSCQPSGTLRFFPQENPSKSCDESPPFKTRADSASFYNSWRKFFSPTQRFCGLFLLNRHYHVKLHNTYPTRAFYG